jgi:putative endonuclease
MRDYYVYILASQRNGTIYIGVTNNLQRRIEEHQSGLVEGFTKRYHLKELVYYEQTPSIEAAILREKQLKKWNRAWKVALIEKANPIWKDLSKELF